MTRTLFLLTLGVSLLACAQDKGSESSTAVSQMPAKAETPPPPTEEQRMEAKQQVITVTGTVVFKPLEGGFFGFDADNGAKYMPRDLPKDYLKHGYRLKLIGVERPDILTFQQYGQVFMVKQTEVLATPDKPAPNEY